MVIKSQKMQVTFLGKSGGEQYFMRTSYDDNISNNQRKMKNESPQSTYRSVLLKSVLK